MSSTDRFSRRPIRSAIRSLLLGCVCLGAMWAPALAGDTLAQASPPTTPPTPGDPFKTIPEKIEPRQPVEQEKAPQVPPAPPGSLSDKLGKSEGVITPRKGVDPEIRVPPPDPNPGNMPVIPPPGSPGNPSPVIPK